MKFFTRGSCPGRRDAVRRGSAHGFRPQGEEVEGRIVLSTSPLLTALTTSRAWIDYAPSYASSTDPYNANPSDAKIKADMKALRAEGWQGLVTYTIQGSYADIPRLAKAAGFKWVIAGIYDPTSQAELANAKKVLPYTDGFMVGNEGLADGRYTFDQLAAAVAQVRALGKPVTTSEPGGQYFPGAKYAASLIKLGDWLFPNVDYFLWGNPPPTHSRSPAAMWVDVKYAYQNLVQMNQTKGPVVVHETFFPTANLPSGNADPNATQANQVSWYGTQAFAHPGFAGNFYFVWGEAFDQPWKHTVVNGRDYEPFMGMNGLNQSNGEPTPKASITQLKADYTGTYGKSRTATRLAVTAPRPSVGTNMLYARVVTASGGAPPQGTVRFFDGGQLLGSAPVADGQAQWPVAPTPGVHQYTAEFEGDGDYLWSTATLSRRFVIRNSA
jgi:exo-beta-1,3-glucanase (GH17 family)